MIISAIVAVGKNQAIGVDNDLPWHMPADLKFFKETTLGHYVIMGRKSFESVGRPLPGRTNIVVTRNKAFYNAGVTTVHSIPEALLVAQRAKQKEVFVIGGSNIYTQTIDLWHKLYLTKIHTTVESATAFFPKLNMDVWTVTKEQKHQADDKNPHDYTFCTYERPW